MVDSNKNNKVRASKGVGSEQWNPLAGGLRHRGSFFSCCGPQSCIKAGEGQTVHFQ